MIFINLSYEFTAPYLRGITDIVASLVALLTARLLSVRSVKLSGKITFLL